MAGPPQAPAQAQAPAQGQGQRPPERRQPPPAAPAPATEPPAPAKRQRGTLVPAVIVAVALLGAAFLLRGGSEPSSVATTPTTEPSTETSGNPSHVVSLDPVTLNLADGNLAKVGIAIELRDVQLLAEIGEEPRNFGARALDELISVLGEYTTEQITAAGGKDKFRAELGARVSEAYHGDVVAVYLTELAIP